MSTPTQRHTASRGGKRRAHTALKKSNLSACPQCGEAVMPHKACKACGTYKGKQVLKIKSKLIKNKKTKIKKEDK